MYLADFHTHSCVSPDSAAPMLEMAAAAAAAGLDAICFTDHFEPVEPRTTVLRQHFDWNTMTEEYARTVAQWDGPVALHLGVELGDAPVDIARTEALLEDMPELDFILGSTHMLSKKYNFQDLAWLQEPDEKTCYEELEDYWATVLKMARWGRFTVMSHLTLPLRYMNGRRGFHVSMDGCGEEIEAVFRVLIEQGCGIEVNTNRGGEPLPNGRWLNLYRQMGGELITLGSDAHRCEDVGRGIREGQALLRECGYTRFCTFEKQKPVWHAL